MTKSERLYIMAERIAKFGNKENKLNVLKTMTSDKEHINYARSKILTEKLNILREKYEIHAEFPNGKKVLPMSNDSKLIIQRAKELLKNKDIGKIEIKKDGHVVISKNDLIKQDSQSLQKIL